VTGAAGNRRRRDPVRARGFTLVEALLAITLAGVLASAALSLLLGQRRFYERSAETIYARQSVRASLDLIAAEVRQASAADILAAAPDSLVFRFDVTRAVVCDSTGPDEVVLLVFDSVRAPNVPAGFRGAAVSGPYDSTFVYADGWFAKPVEKGAGPRLVCSAAGAPVDLPPSRYRRVAGWTARVGRLPLRGALVRSYGRLSLRVDPSSFEQGLAIRRNGQELAAPFAIGSGFRYLLEDGSELGSVGSRDLGRIRAVRVRLQAADPRGVPGTQAAVEHLIFLRN
jgi:prepilin-type N-terminal cleavage/methylation domain-containing protein